MSFSHLRTGGSFFVIADSIIGPFFFGYGRSTSPDTSFYMFLNRSF